MKKVLLAGTALVGAALITSTAFAQARNPSLSLGGFFRAYVVGITHDDGAGELGANTRNLQQWSDAEIHFNAAGELANGLRVTARIELEGQDHADRIDENWLRFAGGYGTLTLGGTNNVSNALAVRAPGGPIHATDDSTFVGMWLTNHQTRQALGTGVMLGGGGDPNGIYYQTPSFSGFSLAASYQPEGTDDAHGTAAQSNIVDFAGVGTPGGPADVTRNGTTTMSERFAVAGRYDSSWLRASLGYFRSERETPAAGANNGNRDDYWAVGGGLSVVPATGWTIGGAWGYARADRATNVANSRDFRQFGAEAGVTYAWDAWLLGLSYAYETTGNVDNTRLRIHNVALSGSYALGNGVDLIGGVLGGWTDVRRPAGQAALRTDDYDYIQFTVGTRVNF